MTELQNSMLINDRRTHPQTSLTVRSTPLAICTFSCCRRTVEIPETIYHKMTELQNSMLINDRRTHPQTSLTLRNTPLAICTFTCCRRTAEIPE
ncbi:hypothetical protein CEXT_505821 [Caerostris extrusa]|uniref:Uncharacterized protein n=1 Tax=Caerostris extrusa TaxID=172846 RepID=A0AAV4MFZ0_CAEEX|nr:hypothetical protein CEXT_505821 [Caerostris extrusa]